MKRILKICIILMAWLSPFFAGSQGLFESEELMKMTIECHFDSLFQFYRYQKKYQKTRVSVDGTEQIIKMRVRGNSRRTEEFCHYPPLLLNFKKSETSKTIFEGQKKLKLVTPCLKNIEEGVQLISREFLAYKIYNLLTDSSFRVRPIQLQYRDFNSGKEVTAGSFLIEDAKMLAGRLNLRLAEDIPYSSSTPDYFNSTRVSLFHFMIGNHDWYFPNHNMRVLASEEPDSVAVPYDFDLSGFVDAPYAEPRRDYYQQSVKDRYFLGHCRTREEFEREFVYFRSKRQEILQLIDSADWIPRKQRTEMHDYIESFYAIINSEQKVQETIMNTCQSFY